MLSIKGYRHVIWRYYNSRILMIYMYVPIYMSSILCYIYSFIVSYNTTITKV